MTGVRRTPRNKFDSACERWKRRPAANANHCQLMFACSTYTAPGLASIGVDNGCRTAAATDGQADQCRFKSFLLLTSCF